MNNVSQFGVFKKAAKLAKDPSNGCRIVLSKRHFALSPRFLGRLKKGVMEILESEIGRYSESLHGVPLAYCNLQMLQPAGNILDDQPFIHFNVSFRAVVFQPTIGSVLKCKINEFASDHISCLVHDWFNLSLPLQDPDLEHTLPRGSKVMATVTSIQEKNGILAIQGIRTGDRFPESVTCNAIVPKLEPVDEEAAQDLPEDEESTARKRKHDSGFISDPDRSLEAETSVAHTHRESGKKKKKKEKKIKVEVTSDDEQRTDKLEIGNTSSNALPALDSMHNPEIDRRENIKYRAIKVEPVTDDEITQNDDILRGEKTKDDQSALGRLEHFGGCDSNDGGSQEFVKKPHKKKKKRKHTELESVGGDIGVKEIKTEVDLDEENTMTFGSSSKKKKRKEQVSGLSTSVETLYGKRVKRDDGIADIQHVDCRSKKQNGSTVFESANGIPHIKTENSDQDSGNCLQIGSEHTKLTSLGKGYIVENQDESWQTKRTKQGESSGICVESSEAVVIRKKKKKKIKREEK